VYEGGLRLPWSLNTGMRWGGAVGSVGILLHVRDFFNTHALITPVITPIRADKKSSGQAP
jgi:hypothetical protein